ncbi:MAG: FAD-dependent thymidylate synthase [Pseudomonadota bacterium]
MSDIDDLVGKKLPVLDDGFVRLVDFMGNDSAIVQAARISYGAGTKKVSQDRGLIRYLMRHRHTSPFEMCEVKLHVRVPMDTWRQWIRHRTASVNEYSTRYSIAIDVAQRTEPGDWRTQNASNKQGSGVSLDEGTGERLTDEETRLQAQARSVYRDRISSGVAREQARKDLPLSTYTEAYWKIDLHNLFHFLALRGDPKAQQEIREYADLIGSTIVKAWCPLSWEAFEDYVLHSVTFSRHEITIMKRIIEGDSTGCIEAGVEAGIIQYDESGVLRPNRERREIEAKLASLGHHIPWKS